MEKRRTDSKEMFGLAPLPPPCLLELSWNVSGLANLKLNESRGHDVVAKHWNTASRSGEGRLKEVMTSFMLPWSGHVWRRPVTSGKKDICRLQPAHAAEGRLKGKSSKEVLKAEMACIHWRRTLSKPIYCSSNWRQVWGKTASQG